MNVSTSRARRHIARLSRRSQLPLCGLAQRRASPELVQVGGRGLAAGGLCAPQRSGELAIGGTRARGRGDQLLTLSAGQPQWLEIVLVVLSHAKEYCP